jgi:hypothetical protein
LFTRLAVAEAELRAMKDMLAELKDMLVELKVNHDELRRDRDEWRWRAERLLADQQGGAWWRWNRRADAAFDAVAADFRILLANAQKKLAKIKADRDRLRRDRDQWRISAERPLIDQREPR